MKDSLAKVICLGESKKILRMDLHLHSNFSDGESSIEEHIISAKDKGLEIIAVTDHVWRSSTWVDSYVGKINLLRDKYDSITVLAGLEAKAIDLQGNVDVTDKDADRVDFIMGVIHRFLPEAKGRYGDLSKLTPREASELEATLIIAMIENPKVNVIGHPTRTYYRFHFGNDTRDAFPDALIRKMAKKAAEYRKPLEYNTTLPFRYRLLKIYLEEGAPFIIGSDSHNAKEVGSIDYDELRSIMEGFGGRKN